MRGLAIPALPSYPATSMLSDTTLRDLHQPNVAANPDETTTLIEYVLVFSVIQPKVLAPNDFTSLQAIVDRLDAFEHHYNQIATPFDWTFTRHELEQLIARVAQHEPQLRLAA
jgi:hypothetical protein